VFQKRRVYLTKLLERVGYSKVLLKNSELLLSREKETSRFSVKFLKEGFLRGSCQRNLPQKKRRKLKNKKRTI